MVGISCSSSKRYSIPSTLLSTRLGTSRPYSITTSPCRVNGILSLLPKKTISSPDKAISWS